MIALLKIEWIKTMRTWMTFVLSIGLPVFFSYFSLAWSSHQTLKSKMLILQVIC